MNGSAGIITLSEVSQSDRERQIVYSFTYMWKLKPTQDKQTHRNRKPKGWLPEGRAGGMVKWEKEIELTVL